MDFINKKIWTITDGSQGMISQVMGLAQHLGSKIIPYTTELFFPWSHLQPGLLPIYKWIFINNIDFNNKPDIAISCGRKSVYLSLMLKKIYKKDIITIHIQNPKINCNNFDYIVAPNHDLLKQENVINSIGAIHHFTYNKINSYNKHIGLKYSNNLVSIIIGGENNHYQFSKKVTFEIIKKIKLLKQKYKDYNFMIISSRRTSDQTLLNLKQNLNKIAFVWDKKTTNPYLYALKNSNFFIVTSDSTSMISECAVTGKPVYVFHLPFKRESKRIVNFHKEFENIKITKKFNDNLVTWDYKKLDEAKRIAGILKQRILKINTNES